jgi:hypothetical protein
MTKICYALASLFALALFSGAAAPAQSSYPIIDKVAASVVSHYQNSSCQQLAAAKQQPSSSRTAEEQKAVHYLHQNPQAAQYFINKVAAPIANKMFQCGMIP